MIWISTEHPHRNSAMMHVRKKARRLVQEKLQSASIESIDELGSNARLGSRCSGRARDEVPQMVIRESHQRPREILISGGKGLFQRHRSRAAVNVRHSRAMWSIARVSLAKEGSQITMAGKDRVAPPRPGLIITCWALRI